MACETRIDAVIKATVTDLIRSRDKRTDGRKSLCSDKRGDRQRSKGVALENGEIVFTMSDGAKVSIGKLPEADIPKATGNGRWGGDGRGSSVCGRKRRMSVDVSETVEQNDDAGKRRSGI